MKNSEEMINDIYREGDRRIAANKKRNKKITAAVSCAAVLALAFGIWRGTATMRTNNELLNNSQSYDQTEQKQGESTANNEMPENTQAQQPQTGVTENTQIPENTEPQGDVPDGQSGGETYGGDYVGSTGGFFIPLLPFEGFEVTGEEITDSEAQQYFSENREHFTRSLASSGVNADNLRFAQKGYCHASYNGSVKGEVRRNFRDYIIYNGEEIAAIVTLVKENGVITDSIAFGAPWFAEYNARLNEHRGEELVFVYASWAEIVIAPDGSYFSPAGTDVYAFFHGNGAAAYEKCKFAENVYIPE